MLLLFYHKVVNMALLLKRNIRHLLTPNMDIKHRRKKSTASAQIVRQECFDKTDSNSKLKKVINLFKSCGLKYELS